MPSSLRLFSKGAMTVLSASGQVQQVAECECGTRHLVRNLRFAIATAFDDSSSLASLTDGCDCKCCAWLEELASDA